MPDDADPLVALVALASMFTPTAVRVAATLRLPDLIGSGAGDVPALAARTGADPDALRRLLRYLTAIGLVGRDLDGAYTVRPTGAVLRDDHPAGMRRWLDLDQDGRAIEAHMEPVMARLLDAVRTGGPVHEQVYGHDFWTHVAAHPELGRSFDGSLALHAAALAPHVSAGYDWASVGRVVDVGGGDGTLLAALLDDHPDLSGIVVEQPGPAAAATGMLARFGDRVQVRTGSFFDPLPGGADVYLIANTLHNWPDRSAAAILGRCAEAAGPGRRVVLAERVVETGGDDELMQSYADLLMLVLLGARERTLDDFVALAEPLGLRLRESRSLPHPALSLLAFDVEVG